MEGKGLKTRDRQRKKKREIDIGLSNDDGFFYFGETLVPKYVNLSTNFKGLPLKVKTVSRLEYMYSALFAFTRKPMSPIACSRLCSMDSI